jgi:hypothetical protein
LVHASRSSATSSMLATTSKISPTIFNAVAVLPERRAQCVGCAILPSLYHRCCRLAA